MARSTRRQRQNAGSAYNYGTEEIMGLGGDDNDVWRDITTSVDNNFDFDSDDDNVDDGNSDETTSSSSTTSFSIRYYCSFVRLKVQQGWKMIRPSGTMPLNREQSGSGGDYPAGLELNDGIGGDEQADLFKLYYKLRLLSLVVFIMSIIFWLWAMKNTREMKGDGKDLGIYSFATTFVSSFYTLIRTKTGTKHITQPSLTRRMPLRIMNVPNIIRTLITMSHIIVSTNYGLGIMYALTVGTTIYVKFLIYCIIFMILWFAIAIVGYYYLREISRYEYDLFVSGGDDDGIGDDDALTDDASEFLYRGNSNSSSAMASAFE